jgi:hypothetical protein
MISKYGRAMNFDGDPNESNHKYLSKAPAKKAQGRTDTFDEQTSHNLACQIVLNKACRDTELFVGNKGGIIPKRSGSNCEIDIHKQSSNFVVGANIEEGEYLVLVNWKKYQNNRANHLTMR